MHMGCTCKQASKGQSRTLGVFPSEDIHLVFLRQGLSLGHGAHEIILAMWLAGEPQRSASPALESEAQAITLSMLHGFWGSNSGPYACMSCSLTTESFVQLLVYLKLFSGQGERWWGHGDEWWRGLQGSALAFFLIFLYRWEKTSKRKSQFELLQSEN